MTARPIALPRKHVALTLLVLLMAAVLWMTVFATDAQAKSVRLDGVRTTLVTNPDTTTLLFSVGIIPLPIAPTPVVPTPDAAKYSFPITRSFVDAKTLVGKINHSGGILLASRNMDNSWTALSLAKFTIRIDAAPDLTALVNGATRLSIADLDLSGAEIKRYTKGRRAFIKISDVAVNLNKTATDAIEATFLGGADALPDSVPLGTATVLARVAR